MAQTVAAKLYPPPREDTPHHVETFSLGKTLSAFVCGTTGSSYELHVGDFTGDKKRPEIAGVDFWVDQTPPIRLMGYPTAVAIHDTKIALAFATGHFLTGTLAKSTKTGGVHHSSLCGTTVPHACMHWIHATELVFAGVPQNGDGEIVVAECRNTAPRMKSVAVMTRPPAAVRACISEDHPSFAVLDIGNTVQIYTKNSAQGWRLSQMVVNLDGLCALSKTRLVAKETHQDVSSVVVYNVAGVVPKVHTRISNAITASLSHMCDDLFAVTQTDHEAPKLLRLRNIEASDPSQTVAVCSLGNAPETPHSLSLVHNENSHVLVHYQRGPLSWAIRA